MSTAEAIRHPIHAAHLAGSNVKSKLKLPSLRREATVVLDIETKEPEPVMKFTYDPIVESPERVAQIMGDDPSPETMLITERNICSMGVPQARAHHVVEQAAQLARHN